MQSVLISIRPQWCAKIANGEKTIEVRKSRPKLETPFKCYIYCMQDKEHTLFKDWIDPPFVTKEYNIMRRKGAKNVFADNRPWGNANGKVIGEFVCDEMYGIYYSIYPHDPPVFEELGTLNRPDLMAETCLSEIEINDYLDGETGYGWHISALQIYDKPMELSEFKSMGEQQLKRPFQSWGYINEQAN